MEYRNMGRTGVQVSTICLGAMTFGEPDEKSFMHGVAASEETSHAMIDHALAAGVNFIDTADVYGNDGLSERVIGRWFQRTGRRRDVVLATKCRFRMFDGPLGTGASRRRIIEACEASLKRLQTDYIDLFQIHMQDRATPEAETLRALDDLVSQGKVLYYGCSNYTASRLVESDWTAEKRGFDGFATHQAQYSLSERHLELEHIPYQGRAGIGTLPWSPLASGLLSGKYRKGEEPPAGTRLDKWKDRLASFADNARTWAIVDALRAVAAELDTQPATVALAWLIERPTVSSVIIGARTLEQLQQNIDAASLKIPAELTAKLDEASALDLPYPYNFIKNVDGGW